MVDSSELASAPIFQNPPIQWLLAAGIAALNGRAGRGSLRANGVAQQIVAFGLKARAGGTTISPHRVV